MTCGFLFLCSIYAGENDYAFSFDISHASFLVKTSFTDADSEAGDAAPGEEKSANLGRIRENPSGYRVKVRNGEGREARVRGGGTPGEIGLGGGRQDVTAPV